MMLRALIPFAVLMIVLAAAGSCETTPPQPVVWTPPSGDVTAEVPQTGLNPEPAPADDQPAPTPTEPVELTLHPPLPDNVNPLTGLVVANPDLLNRRPVMVKVSNYPRTGRPHAGLTYADIVFEYYIGYGFNRFMAVYLGQDAERVGPVRSGRLVDAQLAEMYQGLLFYGNADDKVDEVLLEELGSRALAEKFIPSPPKYRIDGEIMETTLFVNTAELTDYVNRLNQVSNSRRDLRGMIFSDEIHPINEPASFLAVQFSRQARGEWVYNNETSLYERWIESGVSEETIDMIPLVDRLNNQQVTAANVVILYATYTEFAPTLHDIAIFDQNAGKRAIFFRDGLRMEGTWKAVSNGRPIMLFNSYDLPYHLKPGNTWFILVGDLSTFRATAPGQWELRFDIP